MIGGRAEIRPYDPASPDDRFAFRDALARLILADATRSMDFRGELVDGAWWLAKQLEDAACRTRAS